MRGRGKRGGRRGIAAGRAGQITYGFEGNATVVRINAEGGFDSLPEMEIQLQGNIDPVASDFFL